MRRSFYQVGYRFFRMPWDMGPRDELVQVIESGRIPPGRAIDLGCGTGSNAIFLAQHGFDTTGVDFADSALVKAKKKAEAAGVAVSWVADDLTALSKITGTFDLLVDWGAFDDLDPRSRDLYLKSVLPLTHVGTLFLLWCFEWQSRWWETAFGGILEVGKLSPGELHERFGPHFEIECVARKSDIPGLVHGHAAYLMTRR